MSNVKRVDIKGTVPFTLVENDEMLKWLGRMNGPTINLEITWGECEYVPNRDGTAGMTAVYFFQITGEEAIRWESLKGLCKCLMDCGAIIEHAIARDIEDTLHGSWEKIADLQIPA